MTMGNLMNISRTEESTSSNVYCLLIMAFSFFCLCYTVCSVIYFQDFFRISKAGNFLPLTLFAAMPLCGFLSYYFAWLSSGTSAKPSANWPYLLVAKSSSMMVMIITWPFLAIFFLMMPQIGLMGVYFGGGR